MRNFRTLAALFLALGVTVAWGRSASAHQPYFEDEDFSVSAPYRVANPTVSTAVYATLAAPDDVDYFTFDVEAGQAILFGMSVPDIEGQSAFNPTIVVMGPGLPAAEIPAVVATPEGAGGVVLRDERLEAPVFFEPFSRTRYWDRQEATLTLPQTGTYVAAVLHEEGVTGRYTFVIGQREVLGGDPLFLMKMREFWTPYVPGDAGGQVSTHDRAHAHDHGHGGDGSGGHQHSPYDTLRELLRKFWEFLADRMPRT